MEAPYSRIYAEVNLDHIRDNMKAMAGNLPSDTKIIGVIKTDGYGHGAVPTAQTIDPFVWGYATATMEEAVHLRDHGIRKPVLVLSGVSEKYNELLLRQEIRITVFSLEEAKKLSELAGECDKTAYIHIALDTGMSRIGYELNSDSIEEIWKIGKLPHVNVEGIFTHFSRADETDHSVTEHQFKAYLDFVHRLAEGGLKIPVKHCANSAAILDYPHMGLDAVRAGIAMYGLYPSGDVDRKVVLKPAMELYSFITYIKEIKAGTPVSYGGTFVADKTMRIATVSAGYGDGYPRNLSGKGEVLIRGKRASVLGRICMDQFMVDVTAIPEAEEDDKVTLVGRDGENFISMEELAECGGGFHYEIPCVLGKRVPRVYTSGGTIIGKKDYNKDLYEDFMK